MGTWNVTRQVSWFLVPTLTPDLNAWGVLTIMGSALSF